MTTLPLPLEDAWVAAIHGLRPDLAEEPAGAATAAEHFAASVAPDLQLQAWAQVLEVPFRDHIRDEPLWPGFSDTSSITPSIGSIHRGWLRHPNELASIIRSTTGRMELILAGRSLTAQLHFSVASAGVSLDLESGFGRTGIAT